MIKYDDSFNMTDSSKQHQRCWCWQNGLYYKRLSWIGYEIGLWLEVRLYFQKSLLHTTHRRYMLCCRVIRAGEDNQYHICPREKVSYSFDSYYLTIITRKLQVCMNCSTCVIACIELPISTRQKEQWNSCNNIHYYNCMVIIGTYARLNDALKKADPVLKIPGKDGFAIK